MLYDETDPTGDYEIGKNKPPKEFCWKKGQSGNPRGRPKARKSDQLDVAGILNAPVKARIGGKQVKISSFEASIRQTAKKAIDADLRSIMQFLSLCDQFGLIEVPEPEQGGGVVHAPKGVDLHDWLAEETEWVADDE
jgi:hypothetical protein